MCTWSRRCEPWRRFRMPSDHGARLRLPFGTRVGEPEVDTLDVLCFGKESFERIVELATAEFGKAVDGSAALAIEGAQGALDLPVETRPITIAVQKMSRSKSRRSAGFRLSRCSI